MSCSRCKGCCARAGRRRQVIMVGKGSQQEQIDQVLRQVAVFRCLPDEERRRLTALGTLLTGQAGCRIRELQESEEVICVLLRGAIRVSLLSAEGDEFALLLRRQRGDTFIIGCEYDMGEAVEALVDGAQLLLATQHLEGAVLGNPAAEADLRQLRRAQWERTRTIIRELAFYEVRPRLAHVLASQAESEPDQTVHLSRAELAALIGATERQVGRDLRALKEEGLVHFEKHRVRLIVALDLPALAGYRNRRRGKSC